jgi:NAD(P)-dependent dehydrogenase (short-subunit alcohol dehydrogenase family)
MPVALITGANRGLGFEFARQYLGDGWRFRSMPRSGVRQQTDGSAIPSITYGRSP